LKIWFVIHFINQSHNTLDQKTQKIENDVFTTSWYESKNYIFLKQLNEKKRLIFDDIMYKKESQYFNTSIFDKR
jgi:hypothetical protein